MHVEEDFTVDSSFLLREKCSIQFAIFFLGGLSLRRKTCPLLLLSPFGSGLIFLFLSPALFLWLVGVTLLTYVPDTGWRDDRSACHLA